MLKFFEISKDFTTMVMRNVLNQRINEIYASLSIKQKKKKTKNNIMK